MEHKKIRTVTGDIVPKDLGWCQCHEHLYIEKGKSFEINPALFMDDSEKSTRELQRYQEAGGSAYVDAQPIGCGRMAEKMVDASIETNVHIIAVTGFHKLDFYKSDSFVHSMHADELTELYASEVEEGMYSSEGFGCKRLSAQAGVLKIAMAAHEARKDIVYEKLIDAVLHAAHKTNAPILAHFDPDTDAFELLKKMEDAGIEPGRLIACHLDRTRYDVGYHKELAQAGVYLEYDTINRLKYHSNEKEMELIVAMISAGYAEQLLLSLDTTAERLAAYGSKDMGLDYILRHFAPFLKENGVTDSGIHQMMVINPARALSWEM